VQARANVVQPGSSDEAGGVNTAAHPLSCITSGATVTEAMPASTASKAVHPPSHPAGGSKGAVPPSSLQGAVLAVRSAGGEQVPPGGVQEQTPQGSDAGIGSAYPR
jgi:hypothetical protein